MDKTKEIRKHFRLRLVNRWFSDLQLEKLEFRLDKESEEFRNKFIDVIEDVCYFDKWR